MEISLRHNIEWKQGKLQNILQVKELIRKSFQISKTWEFMSKELYFQIIFQEHSNWVIKITW